MSKSKDEAVATAPEQSPESFNGNEGAVTQPQLVRPQMRTDDSHAIACYANFARVTGSPEELILDFGLNPNPMGVPDAPVPVTQRIIVNYFTAKRLLQALHLSVQRHESVFGVLETDVQKRVTPSAMRGRS